MKRIFILVFIAFLTCMTVSAKNGKDEKQVVKDVTKDLTKAYGLKADKVQYSKLTGISYVFIEGMPFWTHSYDYALSDISIIIDNYANILQIGQWMVDSDRMCATCEYYCMIDDDRNYNIMIVYYIDSNIISICVYKED